ncbi:hypothetical protein RCO28_38790 [Streptomyces sp. LHD-70]|uniref:putative T7SS-secreted protein n=1 Tax=Streptomyces sp. LHD-70 TaxID=3072140 RepID=UPI00280EFAFA|nr:hypothetical protein [Streptomyces sp. LHD-70]MDQ8708363.1 hypothetical protein [Streptomyces sp. LHD-70]
MTTPAPAGPGGSFPALGFDPAPGQPAAVTTLAQDIHGTYTKLKAADDVLTGIIKGTGGWTGIAADAFTAKVRELPKVLGEATGSFQRASHALTDWQDRLATMKQQAHEHENRAHQARTRLRDAEMNPDLNISGTFPPDEAAQMQRRIDAAAEQVNAASRDLEAIITEARELLTRHDEIAETVAQQIQKACEQAPDEPGFWDRLMDGLESLIEAHAHLANQVWDWVKDHKNAISAIGDVFSAVSTVTAIGGLCFPPAAPFLNTISGVTAGVALGLHLTARAAGAEVSDRTIWEDGLGVVSFGLGGAAAKIGRTGAELTEAVVKGISTGAGIESVGMTIEDYIADSTAVKYFLPQNTTEAIVVGGANAFPGGSAVVGLGMAFKHAWEAGSAKDKAAADEQGE